MYGLELFAKLPTPIILVSTCDDEPTAFDSNEIRTKKKKKKGKKTTKWKKRKSQGKIRRRKCL